MTGCRSLVPSPCLGSYSNESVVTNVRSGIALCTEREREGEGEKERGRVSERERAIVNIVTFFLA